MEEKKIDKSIFEILKGLRTKKELSLQKLSETSRIQIKYLEALEEGDLLKIPEVYDRLFFRSYLKAIGADEKEYYDDFLEFRKDIRSDKITTIYDYEKKSDAVDKYLNYRNLILLLPVIAVIFVLWILVTNTEMVDSSKNDEVKEIDINNIVKQIREREQALVDSMEQESKPVESQSISARLDLSIVGKEKTWFRVITDKKDTSEYLLEKGRRVDIKADRCFEFLVGRADGLQLQYNGKTIGSLGSSKQVIRYMLLDKSGIVEKRMITPKNQRLAEDENL